MVGVVEAGHHRRAAEVDHQIGGDTVQHRFARFRDLTGRDVRAPGDAAVVALALRAAALNPAR
ncbi:helix-turn-helix domain-containing protein [Streptosporangium roseum]|uniref:helix-turn-helix domain-containing protein n=1 Tax=Streptosporangium roseum TaxID=2001 RepID=UPI003318A308